MNNARKFQGKADAYASLARDAYSAGERELMLRLERSCRSLARDVEKAEERRIEMKGNGVDNDD